MIPIVQLTQADVDWCRRLSEIRMEENRRAMVAEQKRMADGDQASFEGVVGELALARWLDVSVDTTTQPRSGGYDMRKDGYRWDAKATALPNGRLLKTLKENNVVDVYALALLHRLADLLVVLRGYAFAGELIDPTNIIDLGHGPTYGLAQDRLHEFKPKPLQIDRAWVAAYERVEMQTWGRE